MKIAEGAHIIVDHWLQLQRGEKVVFITDESHIHEGLEIKKIACACGAVVILIIVPPECVQDGSIIDNMTELFEQSDVIVGATEFSLITTDAVRQAIKMGTRFLSLPLSTNNSKSLLESDFLKMEPEQSAGLAGEILASLNKAERLEARTELGTRISFGKAGREASFFNGMADLRSQIGSSSFEVYIPIEETKTNGVVILDGSLGYLGAVKENTRLEFKDGYLRSIQKTEDGQRLAEYMEGFQDWELYCACEFGIGLNKKAKCNGSSYIEDESSYGTFHIGFGRNLALGGDHDAKGHFDIVIRSPDIYADGRQIIRGGEIIPLTEQKES